jgi:release factor glutamine methyltransferase
VTKKSSIFVGGPFSAALGSVPGEFEPELKSKLEIVHKAVTDVGSRLLSSHLAEHFGASVDENSLVRRDNFWLASSDAYLALLPCGPEGHPWRTDGTFVEIGLALGMKKPVLLVMEDTGLKEWSYYVRNLGTADGVTVIDLSLFTKNPERALKEFLIRNEVLVSDTEPGTQDISNVHEFLAAHRAETEDHTVVVAGMELVVQPNVFSPRFSRSAEFLMSVWRIPAGGRVLDVGCGCGVLGIGALREGASSLTAVDINPAAVENTRQNLKRLDLSSRSEVILSDAFTEVEGTYDMIVANPPFWDSPAQDNLERSCFDEDYRFLRQLISGARRHARPDCRFWIAFSDQGDYGLIVRLLLRSGWYISSFVILRPTTPSGHIRLAWEARPSSET